jgi:hypothetical protein
MAQEACCDVIVPAACRVRVEVLAESVQFLELKMSAGVLTVARALFMLQIKLYFLPSPQL